MCGSVRSFMLIVVRTVRERRKNGGSELRPSSSWSLRARLATELGTAAVLAGAYVTLFSGRPRIVDVLLAAAAVGAIALDAKRSRRLWAAVPQKTGAQGPRARPDGRRAWREMLVFTACAAFGLAAAGAVLAPADEANDLLSRMTNWHLVPAILLYLPWAWVQQFVFQFYFLGRLLHLVPAAAAVALTAVAFSAVHFPRYPVMAVTAIAGLVWALSYRRHRRVAPLAVSHAVLGPLLHYWVLGRDLLADWLP